MWPFSRKKKESRRHRVVRRVIVGFIIGGAISSIIGNRMLKDRKEEVGEE